MSGRRKSNDGDDRNRSRSPEDMEAGKSSKTSSATTTTARRPGRKRGEDEGSTAAPSSSSSSSNKPRSAGSSGSTSGAPATTISSARRPRAKRSEDDDATVSSKLSQSTKSSFDNNNELTNRELSQVPNNSKDEAADADGKHKGSPSRRTRKDKESSSSPSKRSLQSNPLEKLSSHSGAGGASGAFDSGAFAPGGFGGFADATFGETLAAFSTPSADAAFASAPLFDTGFSTDVKFDTAFGAADFGGATFSAGGFDGFDASPDFPSQPETIWDKSPLTDVPKLESVQYTLKRKSIMTKTFHGTPVNNPANGNIIFAATTDQGVYLHEVDPKRDYIQLAAVPILSVVLQERIAAKYNATIKSVGTVWNIAAGSHGHAEEQIAAVVDFKILEAATSMRIVVVWQRAGGVFQLQYVTTPPAGENFVCDVSTLQVADGLLFVAGSSPKGACIFISKPAVREAWTANFLTGSGSVSAMSVAPSKPYLVVALADMSVTVWTYKAALVGSTTTAKTSKRWLFPLCRLDYMNALAAEKPVYPGTGNKDPVAGGKDGADIRYCTHLAWLPPGPSLQSLMLLAVAFENGFAVFHVDLPVMIDSSRKDGHQVIPEPTQSTVVLIAPILSPIAAKRWEGKHECSFVSWMLYGPHVDPCVAVLLHDSVNPVARIVLCAIHFPLYRKGPLLKKINLLPCHVIASASVSKDSASFPSGLLQSCQSLVYYSRNKLLAMSLSTVPTASTSASSLLFLGHPVTSTLPGLSSSGDPYLVDAETDIDGILYVFSTMLCERTLSDTDPAMLKWSPPTRRIWLCRVVVGDTKETWTEEGKEDQGFADSEEVTGGASSDIVCEFDHESLTGMTPVRIVRCMGRKVCAVLFRPALGSGADPARALSLETDTVALVNFGTGTPTVEVVQGRDLAFFPSYGSENTQGLILSLNGSSLTFFRWNSSKSLELAAAFRPLVGVDSDKDYVDCRRIAIFSEGLKLNLTVLGKRLRDNRVCFVTGDICECADSSLVDWAKLLPNIVSGRSAWLDEGEDVFSIVGLQGDGSGYRNFALATSIRVLILSSALTVAAEAPKHVASSGLSPLGSFAVCFSSDSNVRYLCSLDDRLSGGVITAVAQSSYGHAHSLLMAIRPDRLVFCPCQSGLSLIELGRNPDAFRLPAASTRPAMLLEPMIANAVCIGGMQNQSSPVLRTVIEKFGRKVSSITHGEKEGIGPYGAGLTSGAFAILHNYGLKHAASWLLTGTAKFNRAANTRVLPPWLPIGPKSKGAANADAMLHVISNGDSYFYEYIKSPEQNIASTLPRQSDAVALLCREYAHEALGYGKPLDALKTLDISGAESSESIVLQLSLMLEKATSNKADGVLKSLSGFGENGKSRRSSSVKSSSSLAALALAVKANSGAPLIQQGMNEEQIDRWMKNLAPSLQRIKIASRSRQRILGEKDLECAGGNDADDSDPLWATPCNESKHVWNEGPRREKENLLILDSIEDWLGRRRLLIFGREGASAAKDRGEKTLADILNQDDDSFGGEDGDLESVKDDGWVDGIGEGRSDEANLSAYFRMSEGEDDESSWRTEGLLDLSPYQNKAVIIGDPQSFSLQQSTSSVDEGEPGKVKSLFDLVFDSSGKGAASGLALPAPRGGSLDVGVLHTTDREARKKCSIEFWFYLPSAEDMEKEVVLVRRTMGSLADNLAKVALALDKESVLWELLLRTSGELEFRTCGGSTLLSSQNKLGAKAAGDSKEEKETPYLAVFERWNHVCLVLTSKGLDICDCSVTMFMKGVDVASTTTSMRPSSIVSGDMCDVSKLTELMQKSYLLFGLNHSAGFRMTELRVWACERSVDDTQSFLYEYLTAAEHKKKFKVKIVNKNKKGAVLGQGLGLAHPKGLLGATKAGDLALDKGSSTRPGGLTPSQSMGVSLTPSSKGGLKFSLEPPKPIVQNAKVHASLYQRKFENAADSRPVEAKPPTGFADSFNAFGNQEDASSKILEPDQGQTESMGADAQLSDDDQDADDAVADVAATLWDTAIPLSQQLRPSAASALIRGPPATRHYGGNRGGLPDLSGGERFGVGGIAVCGSEKTIVFRDNEDPPALTYPIGASGAVVSDQMDDEGSEFLCCFLAKEGRMVVFELRSRTVVVELQMTTKLNFWRYLPPEAADNTLCFMLVTPVGGFHWKPLEESPRPHQVWKRGPELRGKKVVSYEEGGSNGLDGAGISSRVGFVTVTRSSGGGSLEGWLLPISGDSQAQQVSDNLLGACLCQPLFVEEGPFLPLLVTVHNSDDGVLVNVLSISEPKKGSLTVGEVEATQIIDETDIDDANYEPPALAMGPLPEVLCVSLSNIIVVILRRKGLVAAFELEDGEINTIAMESVDHFVIDAVMRYSSEIGGAEIVMLLSDNENPKDGRIVSFCFRSAA